MTSERVERRLTAILVADISRYKKDGSELSRFDSLYIVELRSGKWGITGRSSFAP